MAPDPSPGTAPTDHATALALRRARHRGRPRTLLAECGGSTDTGGTETHFLVVDDRYGTPIHVFLELDPRTSSGFSGFAVRAVTLKPVASLHKVGAATGVAIGQHPSELDWFQAFRSNGAVSGAGFILIEPRYVGPDWSAYLVSFRPEGEKSAKRPSHPYRATGRRG
jgi:hypothetical protein